MIGSGRKMNCPTNGPQGIRTLSPWPWKIVAFYLQVSWKNYTKDLVQTNMTWDLRLSRPLD